MTSQQLALIPELFDQALDLDPTAREDFLQQACAGDLEVYREVKSLLGESFQTEDFLKHSALSLATRAIAQELTPLQPGAKLGRYEILSELGHGGMGDVFHARDDIGLSVAIKVLPDYFAQDAERVSRFESEARKMAQLHHPNIAGIHGRDVTGGWRFLVLEYVEGQTLEARLAQGPLPLRDALKVFAQIADALAATHRKDIVHRDLKPSNIMLTPNLQVKLLDFGIAKHFHQLEIEAGVAVSNSTCSTFSETLTLPGFTPGTLPYMSPEQRIGGKVDHTTDLWAFGVVFYEALTGQNPFRRDTREETASAIFSFTPDWQKLPPETPRCIRELLRTCLAKDPAQRLQDAGQAKVIITAAQRELDRGIALPDWLGNLTKYFSRRVILGVGCVAVLIAAYLGWRAYQNQLLRLAVVSSDASTCEPVNPASLAAQLNRLSRIRVATGSANANGLTLQLLPRCTGNGSATLLKLVDAQGLTIFAHLVETSEQALAKLTPVLAGLATRYQSRPSMLNAQINLAAPSFSELKPEEQNILNLDNWDNETLLNSAIDLVNKLVAEKGNSATLQAALSRAYLFKFRITQDAADKKKSYDAYLLALTMEPDSADALLAAGNYYNVAGDEKAKQYFQDVLKQRPYDAEAYRGLGRAYEITGDMESAAANFVSSIIYRPQYWGGYNELGAFYLSHQQYQLAELYLLSAAKLVDNPVVHTNLGNAYYLQDRFSEALTTYENALKRYPRFETYINCGMIRYFEGKYPQAAEYFGLAKEKAPQSPEAWGYLGQALFWINNRRAESQNALRQAVQLAGSQLQNNIDPTDKAMMTALQALWLAVLGQHQEAMQAINSVLPASTAPNVQDHLDIVEQAIPIFHLAKQDELALTWIERFLKSGGKVRSLEREPLIASLRTDPRYLRIVAPYQNT